MNMISWNEIEYPSMFTSAAATIQQGFCQYYSDLFSAMEYISSHLKSCVVCNIEEKQYCAEMENAQKEIAKRFSEYHDFFNVISSLGKMFSWVGWVQDDDPTSNGSETK